MGEPPTQVFPDAERTRRLVGSADFLRGQFAVALRDLEAAAVKDANHPDPYTAKGLMGARETVYAWLDAWWKAECADTTPSGGPPGGPET
jgi:hypothetical protein